MSTALWKGWDDPHCLGIDLKEDYTALGLVKEHVFFPHYAPRYAGLVERERSQIPQWTTIILDDSQAYLVDERGGRIIS